MKEHFRQSSVISFGLTLAVLVAGGLLGYLNAFRLAENERLIIHTQEVIGELEALLSTLKDAETGQRGYLLTGDVKYLQPYDDALHEIQAILAHLNELTSDNAEQQARLGALEMMIPVRLDELRQTVALMKGGDRPAAMEIIRSDTGKAMMDDLRKRVAVMHHAEEDLLRRRAEESKTSFRTTILSILLSTVIGIILVAIVFYLSQRNVLVRQRAAEVLAEQKERLQTTLASIGDAVISTDTEGRITNMNAVAESLTGWKNEEATGQRLDTVFRIINEKTRRPVHDPATKAMKEGVIIGLANHTVLIAKSGSELPIDDSAAPIRCAKGDVAGCVLVFRDVTERKQTEKASRLLAAIVESSDDAIISKDVNGIITSWNQGAERIFGYTAAEAVGRPIAMLAPPDRADEMPAILGRIRRGERIDHFDTVRRAKDGHLVPISLTVSPIKDEDGEIVGASKVARDISERRRAEEALREEKARLYTTLVSIGDAVIVTDTESRITMMNPVAQALTGWKQEVVGRPLDEVFRIMNEQTRKPVESPVSRVMREGTIVGLANHTVLVAKEGNEIPIDDSAAPIKDGQGRVTGVVLVFRDVTERKRSQEALLLADRRKDEFLATLAHELRNPLAPIRNGVELLRRAEGDADLIRQATKMMERQLGQMVRLVDDLLDISRITQGKVQLRKERVELAAVVQSAVEVSRLLIEAQGHELTLKLPSEPVWLDADPTRLAQVFANLLDNAAKYSEKRGRIWLTAERHGGEVTVSVRDTGIGLAAEHLPRIFEMFSQVEPALERSQGGLGIGLALVRGIVELHGGTVDARSAGMGKGSEFIVRLPVVEVTVKASQEPRDGDKEKVKTVCPSRILVVDDNRDAADSLSMMLRMMGHETETAYDGLEAVQAAATFRPHVVVLDIGLPKISGYEAARRIREQPWGKGMALIALTGWGQEEDKRRAMEAGFDHHLTKPVEGAALEKLLALMNPVPQT